MSVLTMSLLNGVMGIAGKIRNKEYGALAYAPPYSSAKDPVNMAGFMAENIAQAALAWAAVKKRGDLLDKKGNTFYRIIGLKEMCEWKH